VALSISGTPPANDFSISASPAAVSVMQGASGTSTISTAVTSGTPETLALSAGGLPAGATASLSPTSVTTGGGSTLSVNTGTAPAGSYTVTVSASGSATHAAAVALTIVGPTTSITGPAAGTTVTGSVTVTATANAAANKIELYVDGALLGSGTTSPFSAIWDSTKAADGSHSIVSKAYDAAGDIATSATVTVTSSNSTSVNPPPTGCSSAASGAAGLIALLVAGLALMLARRRATAAGSR
jgi:uncharacterized protein (TIGR03382 family)